MRNSKNWMVALLVAVAMFLGLSAVAGPASAAGPGAPSSTPYNLVINFTTDGAGMITQQVSTYDQKTNSWVRTPRKGHSHVVQTGNRISLHLVSGESLSKGNASLYYVNQVNGRFNSSLTLVWNGHSGRIELPVTFGKHIHRNYFLEQGFVGIVVKGQPLPQAEGKGGA
jgi:hypothetical protein